MHQAVMYLCDFASFYGFYWIIKWNCYDGVVYFFVFHSIASNCRYLLHCMKEYVISQIIPFGFYHLDAVLLNIKSETKHTSMSKHFHIQSNRNTVETDAKTIPLLTHIYMTAHFSGFLRVYNKKWRV